MEKRKGKISLRGISDQLKYFEGVNRAKFLLRELSGQKRLFRVVNELLPLVILELECKLTITKLLACSRKEESRNELCLDLRKQDAANVPNLLRFHLKQLANIPCKTSAWPLIFINSFVGNYLIYLIFHMCSY